MGHIAIMIGDYLGKVKAWAEERKDDLFVAAVIFLTGLGSFGLGRLSAVMPQKPSLAITGAEIDAGVASQSKGTDEIATSAAGRAIKDHAISAAGKYVASKSGAAYHLPWCPGALRIKESNKIWFQTKEEAAAKGYKPAGNCPGL